MNNNELKNYRFFQRIENGSLAEPIDAMRRPQRLPVGDSRKCRDIRSASFGYSLFCFILMTSSMLLTGACTDQHSLSGDNLSLVVTPRLGVNFGFFPHFRG